MTQPQIGNSSRNGVNNTWVYDSRGRASSETVTIGGSSYTTSMSYNSADLPTSMTYPDNETVNFTYTPQMALNSVIGTSTYLSSSQYDAAGRLTQHVLGNGLTQEYTYNSWTSEGGRLANLTTGTLQDLTYSYDDAGNILSIVDDVNGPQTQSFAYDALQRLTSASATGGQNGLYNESYTYNSTTGNLASKAGVNYTYDANHPHAVSELSNGNTYTYDANGNQTERVVNNITYTLSYDAENRMVGVSGNGITASFTYDADGKRVQQVINSVTTKFIGNHYEVEGTTVRKYYLAGATRVAMRTGTNAPVYFLQDHLGSTSLTTDSSGNLVSQLWFKAWGEIRYSPGTMPTNYTYTGQYSNTADFGLMYYGARWYDSSLGRFSQPDSIIPGATQGTQAWDRYAYANNNPILYKDPSGHWINVAVGAILGSVVGIGLYAMNVSSSNQKFNFAEAATVAAVGAASGALISTGIGAVAGIELFAGIGMATSAGGYLVANTITGDDFKESNFIVSTSYGFANGALGPVVGTTLTGALALGGLTSASSYAVTNLINGDPISKEGLLATTAAGLLSAGIGGKYPRIDNRIFVDNPSRYLLSQGIGSFFKGGLGAIISNLGLDIYNDKMQIPSPNSVYSRQLAIAE